MASNSAAANKEEGQMSGDGNEAPAATRPPPPPPPQQQQQQPPLKCPRCDSTNTKFCYYNNYSQSQPRHFCKACRRYWTKGGALRTVPVGGSCRRSKKMPKSYSARYSDIGELGYLNGVPRPMEFRVEGLKIPSFNTSAAALISQLSSLPPAIPPPNPRFSLDQLPPPGSTSLFDFNFSFPSGNGAGQEMAPIEPPLSATNQDLPRNPQLQMVGPGMSHAPPLENQIQQPPQPILFQNPDISAPPPAAFGNSAEAALDWLLDDFTFPSPPTNGNGKATAADWEDLVHAWANVRDQHSSLP